MPVTGLVALTGTTPVPLVVVSPNTKAVVKRVMAFNGDTAAHRVQIGMASVNPDGTLNAGSFTQILPDIPVGAGQEVVLEVPPAYAYSTVSGNVATVNALAARLEAASAAPVQVVVEYEVG